MNYAWADRGRALFPTSDGRDKAPETSVAGVWTLACVITITYYSTIVIIVIKLAQKSKASVRAETVFFISTVAVQHNNNTGRGEESSQTLTGLPGTHGIPR